VLDRVALGQVFDRVHAPEHLWWVANGQEDRDEGDGERNLKPDQDVDGVFDALRWKDVQVHPQHGHLA
jgi:hypothetical protein